MTDRKKNSFISAFIFFIMSLPSASCLAGWSEALSAYVREDWEVFMAECLPIAKNKDADGSTTCSTWIGDAYYYGLGVQKDYLTAMKWYKIGAERGDNASQYYLGLGYLYGEGVPKNLLEAARWIKFAAENNMGMANSTLGAMYFEGLGVEKDYNKSFHHNQIDALAGYPRAHYNLSIAYLEGKGAVKDYITSYMWMDIAVRVSALKDGTENEIYVAKRTQIAQKLTEKQVERAKQLSDFCFDRNFEDC